MQSFRAIKDAEAELAPMYHQQLEKMVAHLQTVTPNYIMNRVPINLFMSSPNLTLKSKMLRYQAVFHSYKQALQLLVLILKMKNQIGSDVRSHLSHAVQLSFVIGKVIAAFDTKELSPRNKQGIEYIKYYIDTSLLQERIVEEVIVTELIKEAEDFCKTLEQKITSLNCFISALEVKKLNKIELRKEFEDDMEVIGINKDKFENFVLSFSAENKCQPKKQAIFNFLQVVMIASSEHINLLNKFDPNHPKYAIVQQVTEDARKGVKIADALQVSIQDRVKGLLDDWIVGDEFYSSLEAYYLANLTFVQTEGLKKYILGISEKASELCKFLTPETADQNSFESEQKQLNNSIKVLQSNTHFLGNDDQQKIKANTKENVTVLANTPVKAIPVKNSLDVSENNNASAPTKLQEIKDYQALRLQTKNKIANLQTLKKNLHNLHLEINSYSASASERFKNVLPKYRAVAGQIDSLQIPDKTYSPENNSYCHALQVEANELNKVCKSLQGIFKEELTDKKNEKLKSDEAQKQADLQAEALKLQQAAELIAKAEQAELERLKSLKAKCIAELMAKVQRSQRLAIANANLIQKRNALAAKRNCLNELKQQLAAKELALHSIFAPKGQKLSNQQPFEAKLWWHDTSTPEFDNNATEMLLKKSEYLSLSKKERLCFQFSSARFELIVKADDRMPLINTDDSYYHYRR